MYIPEIPNNSLTKEITEIVQLSQKLENEYDFVYYPPATEEEITLWENKHKIAIPESVKDWLRFSNYSNIRGELAVIRSIQDFEIECEIMPEDLVVIGEAIGDGEFICFSKKTGKLVWEDHGDLEIYDNFNKVLKLIIDMMNENCGLSKNSISILEAMAKKARGGKK